MGMEKRSVYHTNQIYLVDVILHVVVSEFLFIYKPNFIFNLVNIISEMVFYLCIYQCCWCFYKFQCDHNLEANTLSLFWCTIIFISYGNFIFLLVAWEISQHNDILLWLNVQVGDNFSWRYAFWGEAFCMLPFAVLAFAMNPLQLKGAFFCLFRCESVMHHLR